jgi:hypothetical protein
MVPSIIGLWKAGRGRRAAVATIAPLVERSRMRLNGIADTAWLDPYLVGFIVMLITLIAQRKVSVLDSHSLGIVQREAWAEITGLKAELIGEEVLHLSATGHRDFAAGCRNAVAFHEALSRTSGGPGEELLDFPVAIAQATAPFRQQAEDGGSATENVSLAALWQLYFDDHVPWRRNETREGLDG